MAKVTIDAGMRTFFAFQKENIVTMLTQILKSKELTAVMNKLGATSKDEYQKRIEELAEEVIDKEVQFYTEHYKVKDSEALFDLIEKVTPNELKKNRRTVVKQVVEEAFA